MLSNASKSKQFKSKKVKRRLVNNKGVVYLGHLPKGFEEQEIREYFTQFGSVKRVKVGRSMKNGEPKGYAHLQFYDEDVAKIAVDSMNNYIMFRKSLKAELVDEHKVHPGLFDTRTARVKKADKALQQYNNSKPANIISNKKRELLKSLGYEVAATKRTADSDSNKDNTPAKKSRQDTSAKQLSHKKDSKIDASDSVKNPKKDKTPATKTEISGTTTKEKLTPIAVNKGKKQTPLAKEVVTPLSKSSPVSDSKATSSSTIKQPSANLQKSQTPSAGKSVKQAATKSTGKKKKAVTLSDSPTVEILTASTSSDTEDFGTSNQTMSVSRRNSGSKKKVFPKTPVPATKAARVVSSSLSTSEEFVTPPQQLPSPQQQRDSKKKTPKSAPGSKKSPKVDSAKKLVQTSDASPALQQRTKAKRGKTTTDVAKSQTETKPTKKKSPKFSPRVTRSAMRKNKASN